MKQIRAMVVGVVMAVGFSLAVLPSPAVHAINVFDACTGDTTSAVCKAKDDSAAGMVKTIIDILLKLLGSISVIMIMVGGIRYTVADGDASRLKNARDTIIYAAVGLIVAIMSYAIVSFVVTNFGS